MHVVGTEPYPWPFDDRLDGTHLALVLPGWDRVWIERAIGVDAVRGRCSELSAAILGCGGLVVGISHRGAPPLAGLIDLCEVTADGIDAFHGGPLDDVLRRRGRTHLLMAGIGLEGPVHSTLRSANDRGYECLLVADAAAPLTTSIADAAAKTVIMSGGIFGAVGATTAVVSALQALPIPTHAKETSA